MLKKRICATTLFLTVKNHCKNYNPQTKVTVREQTLLAKTVETICVARKTQNLHKCPKTTIIALSL